MNKRNLRKLSLYTLIIGLMLLGITYLMFHHLTDNGFTTYQNEPGKPFITNMIGNLSTLFIFTSIVTFISSFIFFKKD